MRIYMPRAFMTIWLLCCAMIKYLIKQLQELIKELTADVKRTSFGSFCSFLVVSFKQTQFRFRLFFLL